MRHVIALLSLYLIALALHAEETPEIDFSINLKLNTPPTHQTAYLDNIQNSLRSCFGPLAAPNTPLKDGAAKYRLFIDGTVTIVFGNTLTQETNNDGKLGGFHQVTYFLPLQHGGTLQFKLCKWDGSKYADVEKWTAPMPTQPIKNGKLDVANAYGGGTGAAKMPWSIEEAQLRAYPRVMPGPMGDAVFTHWLQITPQRVTPSKNNPPPSAVSPITNFDVELTLKNTSPWTLRRLSINLPFQGQVLYLGEPAENGYWVTLVESVATGKTVKATLPARLADKTTPPGILGVNISR